jgi:endonuclease/exonuclease/phosphatase family metal-dependent hydrolase
VPEIVRKFAVAVTLCLAAALTPAVALGPASAAAAADTVTTLRVGSFNLRNAALPLIPGIAPWSKRRKVAIRQILAERLDVFGIQETSFGPKAGVKYPTGGSTQYIDLMKGLNAAGGHYKLTSKAAYNCENPKTPYKCEHVDRGASGGDRILYNTDTLELVSRGARLYKAQSGSGRHFVWAVLRVKATGEEILFTTTHLSSTPSARAAQWLEMIPMIEALKGTRRVLATGDFNVRKNDEIAKTVYPAMKNAGYGDVLNQEYAVNPLPHPRALQTVNGWLGSFNGGRRDLDDYGYPTKQERTGNIIDYVFADNDMIVRKWEVVVNYDRRTFQTIGRLPSDHNLVVATLEMR